MRFYNYLYEANLGHTSGRRIVQGFVLALFLLGRFRVELLEQSTIQPCIARLL